MPGTKSHFSPTDRAVLGQNAEHRLAGYLRPVSILNAPCPHFTSLLNILNVALIQCIKNPGRFRTCRSCFFPWSSGWHVSGKFLDKKEAWFCFTSFFFFLLQRFPRWVSIPILWILQEWRTLWKSNLGNMLTSPKKTVWVPIPRIFSADSHTEKWSDREARPNLQAIS